MYPHTHTHTHTRTYTQTHTHTHTHVPTHTHTCTHPHTHTHVPIHPHTHTCTHTHTHIHLVSMMHTLLVLLAPLVGVFIHTGCFPLGAVWLCGVHGCNPWGMAIATIMHLIPFCPQMNMCGIPLFALAVRLPNRCYFIVGFILAAHGNEESIKRGLLQLVKLVPQWCPHAFMVDCDR